MEQPVTQTEIFPGIVVDPAIMCGVPVVAGTRIPARLIVGQLAGGASIEAVQEAYGLSMAQIRVALAYAADHLSPETESSPDAAGSKIAAENHRRFLSDGSDTGPVDIPASRIKDWLRENWHRG